MRAAFPAKAAKAGVGHGRVGLERLIGQGGQLSDCKMVADPAGMGFGSAAWAIAATMAVDPWTDDGHPVEGAQLQFALGFDRAPAKPGAKPH